MSALIFRMSNRASVSVNWLNYISELKLQQPVTLFSALHPGTQKPDATGSQIPLLIKKRLIFLPTNAFFPWLSLLHLFYFFVFCFFFPQAEVDCLGCHLCTVAACAAPQMNGIVKCDSWHMAKQGLKKPHWSNWLERRGSMPVISRPQKSNDLHNDLAAPANQMLPFSSFHWSLV